MEKAEDDWSFEELKILRELAMESVDAEDRVVEVNILFQSLGNFRICSFGFKVVP